MERDILRITTLPYGERMGISLFSEHEMNVNSDNSSSEEIRRRNYLNSLTSLYEFSLDNVENLTDGDYSIKLFKRIPYAAYLVHDVEPIPTCKTKPLLRFIGVYETTI